MAEDLNSGRLKTTPASGQSGTWTRDRRIASPTRWPLGHAASLTDKSTEAFLMAFRCLALAFLGGHKTSADQTEGAQEYLRDVMQNREIPKIHSTLSEEFVCDFVWQWNIPQASHLSRIPASLCTAAHSLFEGRVRMYTNWSPASSVIVIILNLDGRQHAYM